MPNQLPPNDPRDIAAQQARCTQRFADHFGANPSTAVVAPGRVNLIGEHTDYNAGFVFPVAIERQCVIVAQPHDDADRVCRVISTQLPEPAEFRATAQLAPDSAGVPKWARYVTGVVKGCIDAGMDVPGFDAVLDSTVPPGGGLSSSAAIEVATATLCEAIAGQQLDPVDKALIAQHAEHTFAGVPCGIMDQFISALAQQGHALLIDCKTNTPTAVPLDDPAVSLLIINSNVSHELTGGEYAQRREQCETAAKAMGVATLRESTMDQLENAFAKGKLDRTAHLRARHVITENRRTTQAADKLRERDWSAVGRLMNESHASLRDDFAVSCEEVDLLVELTQELGEDGGVFGSRMTGGGFGGCTVSLVQTDRAQSIAELITKRYHDELEIQPDAFVTRPAAGARVLQRGQ